MPPKGGKREGRGREGVQNVITYYNDAISPYYVIVDLHCIYTPHVLRRLRVEAYAMVGW